MTWINYLIYMLLKPPSSLWFFFLWRLLWLDLCRIWNKSYSKTYSVSTRRKYNIKSPKRKIPLIQEIHNINLRAGCWHSTVTVVSSLKPMQPLLLKIIICSWRCNIQTDYRQFHAMYGQILELLIILTLFSPQ